jgi:hypothetical protein
MRAFIALAGLLVLVLPLDASPGGRPNAREKLVVVDANGKQVGTVVGSRLTQVTIALSVNGRHALLHVASAVESPVFPGTTLLVPPIQGARLLRFESRDCSGPPFLLSSANELLDLAAVASPGMTLYLPVVPRAAPTRIVWNSYREDTGGCHTMEQPMLSDAHVPAAAIVDLLTLFTPPFRVVILD